MDVLIVGAGPGGLAAAAAFAESGARVVVAEREEKVPPARWASTLVMDEGFGTDRLPAVRRTRGDIWVDGVMRERSGVEGRGSHVLGSLLTTGLRSLALSRGVRVLAGLDGAGLEPAELERFDLVVGADGARSAVRARAAVRFSPRLGRSTFRTRTFATSHRFRGVTPIVRTRHLPLVAWGIPHADGGVVVIELAERTYQTAIARRSEEVVLRRLEALLTFELDGAELVPDADPWRPVATVFSRRRVHGNVALIGDAAQACYDPLGRGARWAIEDAIVLSRAVEDLGRPRLALPGYQALRRSADRHDRSRRALAWSEALVDAATRGERAEVEALVQTRWDLADSPRASVSAA